MRGFPLVLVLVLLSAVGGWLFGYDSGEGSTRALIEAQDSTIARLNRAGHAAERRADSLESVTQIRVDTAKVYITRWRTRTDTLTVVQLVALADSTITACESALLSCTSTVEAKDSVIAAVEAERDALEGYREELAERLLREQSRQKWRTARDILTGVGIATAVCALK